MGKVMIINASPRASKSNSKQYAQLFSEYCRLDTEYCEVKKSNHLTLCQIIENYSDIVFVFPLYADSIPVTLLNFLKVLEEMPRLKSPLSLLLLTAALLSHTKMTLQLRCYSCLQEKMVILLVPHSKLEAAKQF